MAQEVDRAYALLSVTGRPAPQGSKNAYVIGKRAVMVEASKHLPAWRTAVVGAVSELFNEGLLGMHSRLVDLLLMMR